MPTPNKTVEQAVDRLIADACTINIVGAEQVNKQKAKVLALITDAKIEELKNIMTIPEGVYEEGNKTALMVIAQQLQDRLVALEKQSKSGEVGSLKEATQHTYGLDKIFPPTPVKKELKK